MKSLESSAPATRHTAPVVSASPQDRNAVLDVLARAFRTDPVTRWAFPDPAGYRDAFRTFAAAFAGRAFDLDSAWQVPDSRGAALWLPPGAAPDEAAVAAVLRRHVPAERLAGMFEIMEQMGLHHPDRPHWYLPMIGVDPVHQGRGCGSALLRHATARLDLECQVAYLESTNALNVPLYERHGFKVVSQIKVGDAPAVYPMVRHPR